MKKTTVAVMYGSRSSEHDISVISALQLMRNIDRQKYDLIPIYISQQGQWYTGEKLFDISTYTDFEKNSKSLTKVYLDLTASSGALLAMIQTGKGLFRHEERKLIARLECVIPVFHGVHGEDGSIQGMLELANIPYTSTGICGSAIGMDKVMMKTFFSGMGFPVLPGFCVSGTEWKMKQETIKKKISELGYPVFIKAARSGSSIGVEKVKTEEELYEKMEICLSFDRKVLVEKGLDNPKEVNCAVMGYDDDIHTSALEMPNSGGKDLLDFQAKYETKNTGSSGAGMANLSRIIPAPIDIKTEEKIKQISVEVFKSLDCKGVVRIDYMLGETEDDLYITEINTIPGSLAFYLWKESGISYPKLIDHMIEYAMKAQEDKDNCYFAYHSDVLKLYSQQQSGSKTKLGSKS